MDLPGIPGVSGQDGLLTVLGTPLGWAFSFFSGFISSVFVRLVHAHSVHVYLFCLGSDPWFICEQQATSFCTGSLFVLFSVIGIPRVICVYSIFLLDSSSSWRDDVSQYQTSKNIPLPCMTLPLVLTGPTLLSIFLADVATMIGETCIPQYLHCGKGRVVRAGQPRHDVWLPRSSDKPTDV